MSCLSTKADVKITLLSFISIFELGCKSRDIQKIVCDQNLLCEYLKKLVSENLFDHIQGKSHNHETVKVVLKGTPLTV